MQASTELSMKPHQSPSTATTAASPLKRARIKPSVNSKRQRNQTDENEYWLRLPDDVLGHILLSATRDPNELFGLEASCKTWNEATSRCWRLLAKDHFNLEAENVNGKDLWNEGRALESLAIDRCRYVYFRNVDYDVFRQGVFFGCNNSIMVMSSSDHNTAHQQSGGFIPASPIRIRDASTLKIIANMDGSPNHKAVDVLGPSGNELIVEYLDSCLKAYRNCKQVWEHKWKDPTPTDNWCLLPSEKALLVVRNRELHVFVVHPSNTLPQLADTVTLEEVMSLTINWLNEGLAFVLHVRSGELTFWNIDGGKHKLVKFRTMRLSVDKCFSFVYAGSKNLVTAGAQDDGAIYVFDRKGTLLHYLVEGVPMPYPNHRWSPMNCCVVNGCMLVSNSMMGAALCVWNMRTGMLVHRFEESIAAGHCFRPGHTYTDGTWVHCLDQLPSFDFPFFLLADNDGSLFSWGFPSDTSQVKRCQMLEQTAARENLR